MVDKRVYDLEDRLVELGALVCRVAADLPRTGVGRHFSSQLIRCGTSPAANYAEARSSESRRDFVHKFKICLKELRETLVWLKFVSVLEMGGKAPLADAIRETYELIAIFVTSFSTARRNEKSSGLKP